MDGKTIFTPLQKSLKGVVISPVVSLYDLTSSIGELATIAITHFGGDEPKDLMPALAGIVESACVIANTGGMEIPDIKATMCFYGTDAQSMALKRSIHALLGNIHSMFEGPQSTGNNIIQIMANVFTICEAYDIEFKDVIDYAINKK